MADAIDIHDKEIKPLAQCRTHAETATHYGRLLGAVSQLAHADAPAEQRLEDIQALLSGFGYSGHVDRSGMPV